MNASRKNLVSEKFIYNQKGSSLYWVQKFLFLKYNSNSRLKNWTLTLWATYSFLKYNGSQDAKIENCLLGLVYTSFIKLTPVSRSLSLDAFFCVSNYIGIIEVLHVTYSFFLHFFELGFYFILCTFIFCSRKSE